MRKQYDDFTQLKLKDMSKTISDMTYKYINNDKQQQNGCYCRGAHRYDAQHQRKRGMPVLQELCFK